MGEGRGARPSVSQRLWQFQVLPNVVRRGPVLRELYQVAVLQEGVEQVVVHGNTPPDGTHRGEQFFAALLRCAQAKALSDIAAQDVGQLHVELVQALSGTES